MTLTGVIVAGDTGCGRSGRSHPADSQERGIENSDHPQSRQTKMSGEGVIGGWLKVRGLLRYSRTSAGIRETAVDWHFRQTILSSSGPNRLGEGPATHIAGRSPLYRELHNSCNSNRSKRGFAEKTKVIK